MSVTPSHVYKFNGIKAISFDVDGTLWDFQSAMRYALRETLQDLGQRHPEAVSLLNVDRMIEIRDRTHEDLRGRVTNLNEVRLESFRRILQSVDRANEGLARHLCTTYFKHRDAKQSPYPDVVPALESLRARYSLGILTNGNTYPPQLGLDGVFQFVVAAQDHGGIEKPDRRLFEIALDKAACAPHELLHVGDSMEIDVMGARKVGARSVWLNRNGHSSPSDSAPDLEVPSLAELVEVI